MTDKLPMTDGEILRSYNTALNKKEQLQILADLNDCQVEQIKSILRCQGVDFRTLPRNRKGAVNKPINPEEKAAIEKELTRNDAPKTTLDDALKAITEEIESIRAAEKELNARKLRLRTLINGIGEV